MSAKEKSRRSVRKIPMGVIVDNRESRLANYLAFATLQSYSRTNFIRMKMIVKLGRKTTVGGTRCHFMYGISYFLFLSGLVIVMSYTLYADIIYLVKSS